MNREILFRGKQCYTGKWVYGYISEDGCGLPVIETASFRSAVEPETIGQYTGLTDKNGRKIFEGDVVLKRTYTGKKPFPVTFGGGMFHCGFGVGSSTPLHRYSLEDKEIEVIGNIHDNPELLEGE